MRARFDLAPPLREAQQLAVAIAALRILGEEAILSGRVRAGVNGFAIVKHISKRCALRDAVVVPQPYFILSVSCGASRASCASCCQLRPCGLICGLRSAEECWSGEPERGAAPHSVLNPPGKGL